MKTKVVGFVIFLVIQYNVLGQSASSNYATQTGTLGTTYSWIDCSAGTSIVTGDDAVASFLWPFSFSYYDNTYTTANSLSVATNGFIRLDGTASTNYGSASSYTLSSTSTELGQIIAMAVYDGKVGDNGGWVKYLVTGSAPNRILTIEYNNLEIDYNDNRYADVQVSFYETLNKIVIKLGTDNIIKSGVDLGLHSGVTGYYNKWQEVQSGTNNAWIEYTRTSDPPVYSGPQASWNYAIQTGVTGATYSWIDCSSGSTIVSGDDSQATVNWPFNFNFYDNSYTTSNSLSVCTNGFIRLDNTASTDYNSASNYNLTSTATNLGQIIAMAVYDGNVAGTGWVKSLVTGTAPNRIFTIEYNNLEIDYNDNRFVDVQVSFYESTNKIVLKLGTDNIIKTGADIGLQSGVNTFFNKWQEVQSGTNSTWIEYTPPNIEVNATIGTSMAFYPTLKAAFDEINAGKHQGTLSIKINHSTKESASAVLNSSGSGSANYSSVKIYPMVSGLSISGNLDSPLIDLNGADNVIIDGRVNATGSVTDLTIINSNISTVSNTSTIRFINSAANNSIQYCNLKGGATGSYSGVLLFAGASSGSGNSGNLVENCNLTSINTSDRPYAAIYSYGTTGRDNSSNTITNNNFYDFFRLNSTSYGIYIYQYSTDWTIEGNSFYETTDFVPISNAYYYAVRIYNTLGNNFNITNNYFGGTDALCGGDAFNMSAESAFRFYAIHLDVGTNVPSSVQGNTIRNFDITSSNSIPWMGIDANSGAINIGTINGNTIGSESGNNSILLTKSNADIAAVSYGIYVNSSGTVNISNNTIGSVTTQSANLYAHSFYGIYKVGGKSGSIDISHNLVGSLITSNSIQAITSTTSGSAQNVYGINSSAIGTTSISDNTVANLFNAYDYSWSTSGQVVGIYTSNGINTIQDNIIRNLTSTSPSSDNVGSAAVIGIAQQSTLGGQNINGNQVYELNSTYTKNDQGVSVTGIFYFGGTSGANTITNNFIHSLNASTSKATLTGIKFYAGTTTIANNIINIGEGISTGLAINGLYENGNAGNDNSAWFNSVYIGGTASGTTASTYALYSATNNNGRDFRNNILYNARTGGTTGKHYAVRISGTTNLTIDYNDYFISGSPSQLGEIGSTDKATFADWKTATSQDANSLNTNPGYTLDGGTDALDYVTTALLPGVVISGITTDYDEETRANPPRMGALESSVNYVWQGSTNNDFGTATNWEDGVVPLDGADISFAANPTNDCYLDQNRILHEITNTSDKKLVVNGKQLTIKGSILSATVNQIDATSTSSEVVFNGDGSQSIPSGVFVSNTIDALTINNEHGFVQNGDLTIPTAFTLTDGEFSIGANTLTINGSISTVLGTLTGGDTSNLVVGGSVASTTLPGVELNNLTLNRANGISLGGDVVVAGTLVLTSGTLTLGPNSFTISGNSPTRVTGNIDPSDAAATMVLMNSTSITCPDSIFSASLNNLTINGAGINACCSCTINGVLNLQSPNPSSTMGLLDMGSNTLTLGENSTVIGEGDVTGIVKREHTFNSNTVYSFGSAYTNVTFVDSNLKPTWLSIKTTIGAVPTWASWSPEGKVQRFYNVARSDNSSTSQAIVKMHYLPSELVDSENESQLVFWHKFTTYNSGLPHEHGKSDHDLTNHALEVTGLIFGGAATTNSEDSEVAMAYSLSDKNTWKGEVGGFETVWEQPGNWTAGHVPLASEEVLIPGGLTYYPSLTASSNALVGTLEIELGASITANSYTLTVKGSGGAWDNHGDFIPGTGTVIFDHGVPVEIMTVAGITNFYNVQIGANTTLEPVPGSIFRIAGAATGDPITSRANWNIIDSTVEWNGSDQIINNPKALDGSFGYNKLILSGSGTKTMPTSALTIADEFVLDGPVTATAQSALTIGNELEIVGGATFATGSFNHTVGGHFDVGGHGDEGTFIPTAGTTITLNGTEVQNIYGSSEINFENLIIDNSAGVEIFTDITLNDELTLTNGVLDVGATNLTINAGLVKTSGYIEVNSSSSLYFGGTSALNLPSSLFYSTPSVNNLTVNRTGGVILNSNLTVHGVLSLQSANPLSSIGTLDMGTSTLNMGENATTTGIGDVTGIVKREHIFNVNTPYSFGSQYSTIDFINGDLAPTWISVKISIGSIPTWTPWSPSPNGKVKRIYQFACSDNSSTAQTNINMRYLLSELDLSYNNEEELIFWHKSSSYDSGAPHEHGKSNQDITNHTMGLTGLIFGSWATNDLDDSQIAMAYTLTAKNTWKGEVSGHETEWEQSQNWTAGNVPLSTDDVLIPGGLSYYPSLTASANSIAQSIEIALGASISANSYTITISGTSGAWINQGTFNAGTGKVLFNHGVSSEIVTIAGTTNFYDIEVAENTTMQPSPGAITRISGTGIAYITSLVDFSTVNNTVEWNGANQNIVNPTGIGGGSGYYNLIISGSGTKTMPTTAMTINGDFSTSGTASVMAADSLYIKGSTTISLGSTFDIGSETHILEGNFENNGIFTAASDGTIIFSGDTAQTILGSSTTNFDKLTINNLLGVSLESNINVANVLTFDFGNLSVGAATLGINGTISNPSGHIEVSSSSSLSFGGTTAFTLNDNLFNSNPTINNLTINRSGGVTLGNESMTVNGILTLTSGTLDLAENTFTLAGSSPIRTNGTIDASNSLATLVFENSAAITLPTSLFSADINNFTIIGSGGITAGDDITINGVLDLQSANPSSIKGSLDMSSYTLDMGEDATTIGQGDVSGIIRRTSIVPNKTYSFGHQYSTISFPDVGTLPTEISLKVTLGSAPSWRTGAIERVYELIQTGGSGTQALIKNHYLDSELNGKNESLLGEWMYIIPSTSTIDYGRSGSDTNENWVTISNVNIGVFASVFGVVEIGMDEYENTNLTWNGSTSTSWVTASNWTPMGAPSDDTVITIPAGTTNDLTIPEIAICGEMIIETGAIVNSISGGELTVTGSGSAWVNNGTFNPDTGTVIFSHGDETETVTISGTTNFNNLALANKTYLQPDTNCIIGIAGLVSADSRSVFDFDTNPNTVVYNGEKEQDIINPGDGHSYYNLSLSVDGTKILPATDFQIVGDFSLSGNANTTSYYDLTVGADLNLSDTSILTMDAVTSLTVSGAIANTAGSGGFVLQSNVNGTASLIHNTDNVPATVERYISGAEEDWHFLSSPVSNQTIISSDWVPSGSYGNGTGYDLYIWDEPTPCWVYQLNTTTTPNWPTVHPSSSFVPGRGYLYSVQELNPINNFEGNLNNGTISYPLTANNSEDLTLTGFNLIGNPYPCAIDWKAASGWTRSNLVDSGGGYDMWIWNPAANNYGVFNSVGTVGTNDVTQYIASMQGFFVRAETNANIVMTNDIRLHTGASNWMKPSNVKNVISNLKVKIQSDSGLGFDEVLVQFGHLENEAGATKLFSTADKAPSVYMLMEKEELSVKYVTDTIDNPFVPIAFKPGSDGNYSFKIDVDAFNFDYLILEDKKSGTLHNLLEQPIYQFKSSINDEPNRFVIHFTEKKVITGDDLSALVFYDGNDIIVDLSLVNEQTEVVIYDMLGRRVINESLQGQTIHHLPVNSKNQIFIVSVKSGNKIVRKKVLVY